MQHMSCRSFNQNTLDPQDKTSSKDVLKDGKEDHTHALWPQYNTCHETHQI